jgi:hypothetical protein
MLCKDAELLRGEAKQIVTESQEAVAHSWAVRGRVKARRELRKGQLLKAESVAS